MEEEDILMDNPAMEEDHSSNNSFVEGIGSSNPIKESPSNLSENRKVVEWPADHPHKDTGMEEQAIPVTEVGVDLTHCFDTDKVFDSREEVIQWCQEVGKNNKTVLVISKSVNKPSGKGSCIYLAKQIKQRIYSLRKHKNHDNHDGFG